MGDATIMVTPTSALALVPIVGAAFAVAKAAQFFRDSWLNRPIRNKGWWMIVTLILVLLPYLFVYYQYQSRR